MTGLQALQEVNRITKNARFCGSSRVKDIKVLIWMAPDGQYFTYDDAGHVLRADYRSDLIQIADKVARVDGDRIIFDMEVAK